MFRLVETSRAIREAVPPELVGVFWVVTLLGSAKFLIVGLSLAYWNWTDRREDVLTLVSVGFVALTVTIALKHGFDLPRPPAAVQRYPVETSSVGFPSGHAIAATVIYGGALLVLDEYRNHRVALVVGSLVVAIGLSRVALGVHYLGDVLAGFAVGLGVLLILAAIDDLDAVYGFAGAAILAVPAFVVTGGNPDSALALGGSLGGLAAAIRFSESTSLRSRTEQVALNVGGVAFVGVVIAVEETVEGLFAAAASVNFLLAFGIVALPWALSRFDSVGFAPTADR